MPYLVRSADLPPFTRGGPGITAALFDGADHELPGLSIILNETEPGFGARRHRHTYDELFVVQEGQMTFIIGAESVTAGPGDLISAPAGIPHSFTNTGERTSHMIAIHAAARVDFEPMPAD